MGSHEVGFLGDEIFDIFDIYNHPVVLVGDEALRWISVDLCTDEVRLDPILLKGFLNVQPVESGHRPAPANGANMMPLHSASCRRGDRQG